jgi:hypothetical protein
MVVKTYLYWDFNDPPLKTPTEMTEQAILDFYWNYYKEKMDAKFGINHHLTTKEACIEEWITVNWAWEKP